MALASLASSHCLRSSPESVNPHRFMKERKNETADAFISTRDAFPCRFWADEAFRDV